MTAALFAYHLKAIRILLVRSSDRSGAGGLLGTHPTGISRPTAIFGSSACDGMARA
jgi:hypothetical protein